MYVPAPPAQPATPVGPPELLSLAPASIAAPAHASPSRTTLAVHASLLDVLEGRDATITGTLLRAPRAGLAGRIVSLQAAGPHGWRTLAHARTNFTGRFRISYTAHSTRSEVVRLRFAGDLGDKPARRRLGRLNVYRPAAASWYGGGGSLACGGSLTSGTLGVANRTLPCGTIITLRYGGHTIRVPVVDRGPFVAGREFDLTEATKQALGFGDTGEVWTTS